MATEGLPPMEAPGRAGHWDREVDDELVCVDVRAETHDVKTFTFASPTGKRFDFKAGQYFMFDLMIDGELHSRCYSVSSPPSRSNAVAVTVKHIPGGIVSGWLHGQLASGAKVRASGPLGSFVRPAQAGAKLLLLSAGSGITPVMSMAREIGDLAEPADIAFVHCGRTPADLIFRQELAGLATRLKQFRLHFLPEAVGAERSWSGLTGRISREYMALAVPDVSERIVLCCGPAPFMAVVKRIVLDLGVPEANYFEESFDAAVIEDAPAPIPQAVQSTSFKVSFSKQNRTIEVPADQTILAAAKRAGLRLPSSCSNGLCGTCKSKLSSGSVDMQHSGGIRQREIDAGYFLPCCSKPLNNLVIER